MNDNHTVLDADANQVAASPMRADIIDPSQSPPRIVSTCDDHRLLHILPSTATR